MSIYVGNKSIVGINYKVGWGSIEGDINQQEDLKNVLTSLAPIDSPHFSGVPTVTTPDDSSSSSQIASTEFVKRNIKWGNIIGDIDEQEDINSAFVHKSGDETIDGKKVFTNSTGIERKALTIDITTTSGETEESLLRILDKNSRGIGYLNGTRSGTYNSFRFRAVNSNISEEGVSPWADIRTLLYDNKSARVQFSTGTGIINQSLSTATTSTSDLSIPTKGWVNNPGLSNVMHLTGNETISGNKTFTDTVLLSSDNKIYAYNEENRHGTYGSNSIELMPLSSQSHGGYIDFHFKGSSGDYSSRIIEDDDGFISINGNRFSKDSPSSVSSQPTEDTTTSKQIDTVGARNTKLQGYVDKSSDETISGTKTFTGIINKTYTSSSSGRFLQLNNPASSTDSYTNSISYNLTENFSDDKPGSYIELLHRTDNINGILLNASIYDGDTRYIGTLGVYANKNGSFSTISPAPTQDTTTSRQIDTVGARNTKLQGYATTSALNNKIQEVSVLPANPVAGVLYVIPE